MTGPTPRGGVGAGWGQVSESPGKVLQMINALLRNSHIQSCIFSVVYPSLQGREGRGEGRGEGNKRGAQFENSSQRILKEASLPLVDDHSLRSIGQIPLRLAIRVIIRTVPFHPAAAPG